MAELRSAEEINPRKRKKINLACENCRTRKVRCDGVRPVCGPCSTRKDRAEGCRFVEIGRPVEGWRANQHVIDLGDSVQEGSTTSPRTSPPRRQVIRRVSATNGSAKPPYGIGEGPQTHGSRVYPFHSIESRLGSVEQPYPGGDSMIGHIGPESQAFFGSSSASSFVKQIRAAVDQKISYSPSHVKYERPPLFTFSPKVPRESISKNVEYLLPSRRLADELVAYYWDDAHTLYPFLDKQRVEDGYRTIWTGDSPSMDERLLMSIVNLMFALGCQFAKSIPPEHRQSSADVYFKRAQELLHLELWGAGSTELVQCLLLMGQYLQSSSAHHQCWMVVGHAVRVAQSLGLHLPESSSSLQSSLERELARRIWHGCILMDRVLSMTFGRPTIISKALAEIVPVPAAIDDEYLSTDTTAIATQPESHPAKMAFYISSLRIYDILNDILVAFYNGEDDEQSDQLGLFSNIPGPTNIARVFQIDRALMNWGRTLPPHIRLSSYDHNHDPIFRRQAIVGRARFLHARILLFRPILAQFCLPSSMSLAPEGTGTFFDESLASSTVLQCSILCLRAAHDLVDLIHTNLLRDGSVGPLPAWWYCVFYLYTAATVLLAAKLRPVIEGGTSGHSVAESWNHAIDDLAYLQCFGESAKRCVTALQILSSKVATSDVAASVSGPATGSVQAEGEGFPALPTMGAVGSPGQQAAETGFQGFHSDLVFSSITFDQNDMSWLNSMSGII